MDLCSFLRWLLHGIEYLLQLRLGNSAFAIWVCIGLGVANAVPAYSASSDNFTLESARFAAAVGGGNSLNFEGETEAQAAHAGSSASENFSIQPIAVPEPSAGPSILFGGAGLYFLERRRRLTRSSR